MADFNQAYQLMLAHEGGYSNNPSDQGGETYRGIARNRNGNWDGWATVDSMKLQPGFPDSLDENMELQMKAATFYRTNFWNPMNGDKLTNQQVANSIFDFGVNAGMKTSVMLAQKVVKVNVDGSLGPISLSKLNLIDTELFIAAFTVAKIARYIDIVKSNNKNALFFFGWVCRALGVN